MIIIYIDIVLLIILLCLTVFTCTYCFYRVYRMQRNGQVAILLRPTKVLFSHKKEGESGELRTVVAYQNPFTGDYCVHKSRAPNAGYLNWRPDPDPGPGPGPALRSPDSGLSDEYEPLHLDPPAPHPQLPQLPPLPKGYHGLQNEIEDEVKRPLSPARARVDNALSNTWNWNYNEYQI